MSVFFCLCVEWLDASRCYAVGKCRFVCVHPAAGVWVGPRGMKQERKKGGGVVSYFVFDPAPPLSRRFLCPVARRRSEGAGSIGYWPHPLHFIVFCLPWEDGVYIWCGSCCCVVWFRRTPSSRRLSNGKSAGLGCDHHRASSFVFCLAGTLLFTDCCSTF